MSRNKDTPNRNKLSEYVDTDFSELFPLTFTHLIEKFKKYTNIDNPSNP